MLYNIISGKIQVKIITTGYYDKDDETLHVLTEEESETFTNMIVTLIVSTAFVMLTLPAR